MSIKSSRRTIYLALPCLLALGAGGALAADAAKGAFSFHETNVLGTSLDLTVCAPTVADADGARAAVLGEVERLRKVLSTYDAATDLAKVNASREPVKVGKEVIEVLGLYERWEKASGGAFSGRLGALVALWKEAEKTGNPPAGERVAAVAEGIKKPLWKMDAAAGTVQRLGDGAINIDSLGKGFIVSQAAAVAKEKVPGARGLLLNIGGDIAAVGSSSLTATEAWNVGIADPAHPADNAATLTTLHLAGQAIATSGGYARGYTIGGQSYSHLLDPRSGYPVDFGGKRGTGVASATVVARDAATANALAAALNVLRPGEGLDLVASVPGAEAILVLNDGTQMRSRGFKRLESPPAPSVAQGKGWPDAFEMSLTLQFGSIAGRRPERPYVAVWVENSKGEHVTTLAEWGNNNRWINGLSSWWRQARNNNELIRAVSRATRPAGKYTLTWNGTDHKGEPVPAGTYKVFVEFAYEHNGHSVSATTITCDGKGATATLARTQHFEDVSVVYGAKGK